MKGTTVCLIVLCDILFVSCLESEDISPHARHYSATALLQIGHQRDEPAPDPYPWKGKDILQPYLEQVHKHSKFSKTLGYGGNLTATIDGACNEDSYFQSELERNFSANVREWTKNEDALCEHLHPGLANLWVGENGGNSVNSGPIIWSRICRKGMAPQLIEPLAGILRHPSPICDLYFPKMYYIDWLHLADRSVLAGPSSKKIFFDAGGSQFVNTLDFFTSHYEKRGIVLDKIYVWEADAQGAESYWHGTAPAVRQKWEPKVTFYDGVPVTDKSDDSANNPVKRILAECRQEDFCVFKLDLTAPTLETSLAMQLIQTPGAAGLVDEFFYEHHATGENEEFGWDDSFLQDAYNILGQLRKMGVRAHPWI